MSLIAEITIDTGNNNANAKSQTGSTDCPCPCPPAVYKGSRRYQECLPPCREVVYRCEEVKKCTRSIEELLNQHLNKLSRYNRPLASSSSASSLSASVELEAYRPPSRLAHSASYPALAPTPAQIEVPAPVASTPTEEQMPAIQAALNVADRIPPPPPAKVTVVTESVSPTSQPVIVAPPPLPVIVEKAFKRPKKREAKIIRCESPYEVLKPIFIRCNPCLPSRSDRARSISAPNFKELVLEIEIQGDAIVQSNIPVNSLSKIETSSTSTPRSSIVSSAAAAPVVTPTFSKSSTSQALVPVTKTLSLASNKSSRAVTQVLELVIGNQTIRIEY